MADIWSTVSKIPLKDLVEDPKPVPEPTPKAGTSMTAEKIKSIVAKLKTIEQWNGYSGIAKKEGVYKEWVMEIEEARQKAISEKITVDLEEK